MNSEKQDGLAERLCRGIEKLDEENSEKQDELAERLYRETIRNYSASGLPSKSILTSLMNLLCSFCLIAEIPYEDFQFILTSLDNHYKKEQLDESLYWIY